tara:strand:- start:4175 stop:4447 length:273 start_codon:yes stop_codon:yes gene_type:complete
MAFKLKRHRKKKKKKLSKKELLIKKLALAKRKMEKKSKNKVKTKKLNNNKQNEVAVAIYNGDSNLRDLTIGHVTSAAGSYRRGRIDNRIQ